MKLITKLFFILLAISISSCSIVFRSSIEGRIIDLEDYDNGIETAVGNARVYIYAKESTRDKDFANFIEGDETSLPDSLEKSKHKFFLSTSTDSAGNYSFDSFVWEAFFSEFGKTADRQEIFLLIYHKDYGLQKNSNPLFVVSDVSNKLPDIKIEDALHTSYLCGKIVDWSDGRALANVTINFYVAKSWSYASNGTFTDVKYYTTPTSSTTSATDGTWLARIAFPMKPNKSANKGNAPVRVSFVLNNYRANDNDSSTDLSNSNLVTNVDLDLNGKTAATGDYKDAFILSTAEKDKTKDLGTISLQRYHFTRLVRGRVSSGATGIGGVSVSLFLNGATSPDAICSSDFNTNEGSTISNEGAFNLGTIDWFIKDISDPNDKKTGKIPASIKLDDNSPSSGGITALVPGNNPLILELKK